MASDRAGYFPLVRRDRPGEDAAHALEKVERTPDEIGASILERIAKGTQSPDSVDTEVEARLADYPGESDQDELNVPR